jgi:hypothetical protein
MYDKCFENKIMNTYKDYKKCESFILVVQIVYIASKLCHVALMERLKRHLFFIVLMRDKYLLYNINVNGNMVNL